MVRDRLPSFAIFVAAITGGFAQAQSVITTIAGVDPVFTGDGKPALSVPVGYINGVATDANGNVYFTDPIERLVLRIASDGTLSVIAGNGINSYSGDGGPATAAAIASTDSPDQYVGTAFQVALGGIAVDKQGNVYFGDGPRVRRVSKDGIITTVAGGGTNTPGNGGSATQAQLGIVTGIALDNGGNLFFAEANRIRKVTPDGTITTYAGTGTDGFSGDGGQATAAQLSLPGGLAFDTQGNLYFTDGDPNHINRVRKITTFGVISTIAGGGTKAPADNLDPLTLNIGYASGIAVDSFGGVYVYSAYSGYLFRFSSGLTNVITSFGGAAFTDNVSARTSYVAGLRIFDNSGIALDSAGNLIVADCRNGRVRKISAGIITTIAGNGQYGFGGDGGPALGAYVQNPTGMAQTPDGTIYFLDTLNLAVRAISPAGIVRTVLNNDNVPNVGGLNGIVADTSGNVFVLLGRKMVRINPDGSIVTVLNVAGVLGDSGDGGLATQATIQGGGGLTRDPIGNLFFSDPVSNRIRRIGLDGRIQSVVGTGRAGTSPDGAVAVVASITQPTTLLADSLGGVYFEESPVGQVGVSVIRYLTPDGHLQTIAGNGMGGFSGDGGPAINAGLMMQQRTGLALDANGLLYIADGFNSRVRMVFKNKNITTVVGTGTPGNSGDGGLAKNASLFTPRGLLFTSSGDLLISDVSANRIRAVLAAPPAMSVSPAQFTFTGKAGGAVTPPQKLSFASAVSGIFFTVAKSANADWLILASGAGYTPRLLTLRADPSNLKPGTYQATLTIAARLATVAPSTITVTFTVAPGDNPKLDVDRASVSFTFPRDFTSPRSLSARVTNAGTGTLAFTAKAVSSTGGNFLSVSPAAGSVTPSSGVNVLITANPTGLQPGTYTGTVTISSATTGETATVQVTMTISTLDQAIQLSHLALSFTAVANGGVVPPASFLVFNVGRGTANFTVSTQTLSGGQQWLSATPKSASDVAGGLGPTITVSVNQTGLAPGLYYGMVRIDAKGSANTPQVVTIIMRVLPPDQDPGPTVTPSEHVV